MKRVDLTKAQQAEWSRAVATFKTDNGRIVEVHVKRGQFFRKWHEILNDQQEFEAAVREDFGISMQTVRTDIRVAGLLENHKGKHAFALSLRTLGKLASEQTDEKLRVETLKAIEAEGLTDAQVQARLSPAVDADDEGNPVRSVTGMFDDIADPPGETPVKETATAGRSGRRAVTARHTARERGRVQGRADAVRDKMLDIAINAIVDPIMTGITNKKLRAKIAVAVDDYLQLDGDGREVLTVLLYNLRPKRKNKATEATAVEAPIIDAPSEAMPKTETVIDDLTVMIGESDPAKHNGKAPSQPAEAGDSAPSTKNAK